MRADCLKKPKNRSKNTQKPPDMPYNPNMFMPNRSIASAFAVVCARALTNLVTGTSTTQTIIKKG
jgi:hypothetical protein